MLRFVLTVIIFILQTFYSLNHLTVGSFIMSHLKNLNETSDPQKQDLKSVLHKSEIMRRFSKDVRKISRNYEVSYYHGE